MVETHESAAPRSRAGASQLRQPRLADIVANRLRDRILTGELRDGDRLPRMEDLFTDFAISPPPLREALRVLENEGLLTVQRGNVGGAIVRVPTPQQVAYTVAMVLQVQGTPLSDVREAMEELEPLCASMFARRRDRKDDLKALADTLQWQSETVDNTLEFNHASRAFHERLAKGCGNASLILTFGALERLWTGNEAEWSTRAEAVGNLPGRESNLASLRYHEKIYEAVEAGTMAEWQSSPGHMSVRRRSSSAAVERKRVSVHLVRDA